MGEQPTQSRCVPGMLLREDNRAKINLVAPFPGSAYAVVDGQYTIALLHNNTIEVHSIHTQEIVQVVTLSSGLDPSFTARNLYRSAVGLHFGAATGAHKVELVEIPLIPGISSSTASSTGPPRTPTKRKGRASISSMSMRSGLSQHSQVSLRERQSLTRILVTGRNGVYTLSPMTLVVQADALLEKGRDSDALTLAENYAKPVSTSAAATATAEVVEGEHYALQADDDELSYVYMRLAFRALDKTAWQDAFDLMRRARCDPRVVVRMFPDLRRPFMTSGDVISVCRGVKDEVLACRTVEDYGALGRSACSSDLLTGEMRPRADTTMNALAVRDNLNRNYSPHLKPDVESATPTVGLKASLLAAARDCLLSYLMKWRAARRNGETDGSLAGDSRKVDIVSCTLPGQVLILPLTTKRVAYRSSTRRLSGCWRNMADRTISVSCCPGRTTWSCKRLSRTSSTRGCTTCSRISGSRDAKTPRCWNSGPGRSCRCRSLA